jgi:hypothetical protein
MNYGTRLTPELEHQILAFIRAGSFVHDAFRAAGVPDRAWQRWMDPAHTRGKFYNLQNKIKQAQATARIIAAQSVKKDDPFKWLANGPARDAPGEPGWAAMANPVEPTATGKIDPLQFPEFVRFVNNVRIVMALFPEARKALDDLMLAEGNTHAIGEERHDGERVGGPGSFTAAG